MRNKMEGKSYEERVKDVNRIYDKYSRSGLSNREILRRYIYPIYHISEKHSTTISTQSLNSPITTFSKKRKFCVNEFYS